MRSGRNKKAGKLNMTPMIDVVFQMIIFFVCTVQIEQEAINKAIELAQSPNGPKMKEEKDPRTITIEVDKNGHSAISRTTLSEAKLRKVLKKTVRDYGKNGPSIPIRIRADQDSQHRYVRKVLDACSSAGLYNISFVAVKDSLHESGSETASPKGKS